MCMMVYLGCNQPPRIISWSDESPAFHVVKLRGERDAAVRHIFTKTHVVYVGSHEKCGCGFSFNEYPELEDTDDIITARNSAAQLADYLESLLSSESNLEVYSCWDGDQHLPQVRSQILFPSQLRQEAFWLEQRSLYHVLQSTA